MAPYARYVPLKAAAPVAAATTAPEHVAVPSKAKQVKVPKGPSRSDDSGRNKRKRAELDHPPTTAAADDDDNTLAVPSKHSAVYSKFQKAAQRSEAAKATAPDDQVDLDHQPELHGMRQPRLALACTSNSDRCV
jgi:ATP-dependent RNA helicase DDX51/DBP6